jgi:hypothetical protein
MANRNFANSRMYTGHVMPVMLDCNFVVDSANGNGLGIRSLKGPYIEAVYMHTSATPDPTSPNPAAGIIMVKLADPYSRNYGGFSGAVSPVTGSEISIGGTSVMTVGQPYVITTVGNATQAQLEAAGLPSGVTAAVGMPMIAKSTGLADGSITTKVKAVSNSGIVRIEEIGDSSLSVAQKVNGKGGYLILQCLDKNGAVAAPADGTVLSLKVYLSNSSVLIQGE